MRAICKGKTGYNGTCLMIPTLLAYMSLVLYTSRAGRSAGSVLCKKGIAGESGCLLSGLAISSRKYKERIHESTILPG